MAAEGPGPTAPTIPLTPAPPVTKSQRLAGLVGLLLLLFGALGFVASTSFDTGSGFGGDTFIGFEVNGWSNVAHVLLGLNLLIAARSRSLTRATWRLVAFVYLFCVIYGLVDGDDIVGLFPVNAADHIFDAVLFLLGFFGARGAKETRSAIALGRVEDVEHPDVARVVGPGSGHVGGPRRFDARIDAKL